jgi:hypothetical protein
MAHKQVLFRSAAREKILRGTTQCADAIRVTLGTVAGGQLWAWHNQAKGWHAQACSES